MLEKELKELDKLYREYRLQVEETNSKLDELDKKIDKYLERWESKNDR